MPFEAVLAIAILFIGLPESRDHLPEHLRDRHASVFGDVYNLATIRSLQRERPLEYPCYWGFDAHLDALLTPGTYREVSAMRLDALIANPFLGLEAAIVGHLLQIPVVLAFPMMGSMRRKSSPQFDDLVEDTGLDSS